jgi:serine/arginine repetitive matrix protein 2
MYNGVGLQTPRGSGTSGYVQRNYSIPKKMRSKLEFLKELKALRENVLPPPRKANQEILQHKQQREIYVKLEEMRRELSSGSDKSIDIEAALKAAELTMRAKFESGDLNIDCSKTQKDTHALAAVKEKEHKDLQKAFDIQADWKAGEAFDFEQQERKRLENLYQKELGKMKKLEDDRDLAKVEKREHKDRKKEKFEEKRKAKKQAKRDERAALVAKEQRDAEIRDIERAEKMLEDGEDLGKLFQDDKVKDGVSSSSGHRKSKSKPKPSRSRRHRSPSVSSKGKSSSSQSSTPSDTKARNVRRKKPTKPTKADRSRSRSSSIKRSRKDDDIQKKIEKKRSRSPVVKNEKKAETSPKKTEREPAKADERKIEPTKDLRKVIDEKRVGEVRPRVDRGFTRQKVAEKDSKPAKDSKHNANSRRDDRNPRKEVSGARGQKNRRRGRGRSSSGSGSSSRSGSGSSDGRDSFDSDSSSSSEY